MLKKEQVLDTLKKYGFYSLNRVPYLYQNKEKIGVYFVWPNKHYGSLERVIYFEDDQKLEEEIYKYWWFMDNKEKAPIDVEFDNYEVVNPQIIYRHKGSILTSEMMKHFSENKNNFVDPREQLKRKQLTRTANILISILKEKCKLQTQTYLKVTEMEEEINKLNNTYNKKLKEYKNDKEVVRESYEILMDDQDESEKLIHALYDELASLETSEELREFINNMFNYLSDLEASESHLQNVYLLNRYPIEIEDLKKKIDILNTALQSKKKIFKNKQNPLEQIQEIENKSECKKMININIYIEKERKNIIEKYQNRENIDENVLGDYLVNFEKLQIEIPDIIPNNALEEIEKNELIKKLKTMFNKLNKREKSACYVASSFLKDCINILIEKEATKELNVNDVISKLILANQIDLFNDAFTILDTYINAKVRVKYFSILNINSFDGFLASLIEAIRTLNTINLNIDKSFHGYYNEKEKNKGMINLHLKNIFNYKDKVSFIATIMPSANIFYSPINIVKQLDIIESTELVERENDTLFLLKNKVTIETKSDKMEVVRFEKGKISNQKEYIVVTEMKGKNKCYYYEDRIYAKENGGLYE